MRDALVGILTIIAILLLCGGLFGLAMVFMGFFGDED